MERIQCACRRCEIRGELWLGISNRNFLHHQPLDPVGDHSRNSQLAVRRLLRPGPLMRRGLVQAPHCGGNAASSNEVTFLALEHPSLQLSGRGGGQPVCPAWRPLSTCVTLVALKRLGATTPARNVTASEG